MNGFWGTLKLFLVVHSYHIENDAMHYMCRMFGLFELLILLNVAKWFTQIQIKQTYLNISVLLKDKFEEVKGIIISRKSKNRQYNDIKRTNEKQLSTNYYTDRKKTFRNTYSTNNIHCSLLCSDFYSRFLNFLDILFCHCAFHL